MRGDPAHPAAAQPASVGDPNGHVSRPPSTPPRAEGGNGAAAAAAMSAKGGRSSSRSSSVPAAPTTPPGGTSGGGAAAARREGDPSVRLHYLEALVEATGAISATLEPDRVENLLLDKACDLLDVPAASVMRIDAKNRVHITAARGLSDEYIRSEGGPMEETIAGRALAEGRTFASWDLQQVADERVAAAAVAEGIVSVACAPLFFAGKQLGALNIYCREPRCFTQDQFYVLSLLASTGAIALSNAQAYRQLRAQAAEVRASFQRVGAALSASLDLGETLRLIVQLAGEMTRAHGGALYMIEDEQEGGGLRLSASRGLDGRSIRRFRRRRIEGIAMQALGEKQVVSLPDARRRTDVAFPALHEEGAGAATREVRSVVCVPVFAGDRPVAILEQYSWEPAAFDRQDVQLLSSFAHQASVAIENARLYAQERGVAQTLQRAFLPELPPSISGFEIGRIYAPGSEIAAVGGDTYDLFVLEDGRIEVLIADVSGQGTHAATLAVMAKYTARAYAMEDPHPSSVLRRVNNALVHQTGDTTFVTLSCALIDPATRHVTIAQAAHPPAVLYRARASRSDLIEGASGLIAGFLPDQEYGSQELVLEPDDLLVFYTDGVIEARRRKVMFGEERLQKTVAEKAHLSAQVVAASLYAAVLGYTEGALNDDLALLVLKAV